MPEPNEAYTLGLLAELQTQMPKIRQKLEVAEKKSQETEGELLALLDKRQQLRQEIETKAEALSELAGKIAALNLRVANLHRDIDTFQKRADEVKRELDAATPENSAELRRAHNAALLQVTNRKKMLPKMGEQIEKQRTEYMAQSEHLTLERDRLNTLNKAFEKLQKSLPDPKLYVQTFETGVGFANCYLLLDKKVNVWTEQVTQALRVAVKLHRDLKMGKYRLDKNSELLGGRSLMSGEALHLAIALGDYELARELFTLITDPNLFFHSIFNIFKVWCAGLYVSGRHQELAEMLRLYQYSEGHLGAYAQCYLGLLAKNQNHLEIYLQQLATFEWPTWDDLRLVRSLGLISSGALAIYRLAAAEGLSLKVTLPTLPSMLLT